METTPLRTALGRARLPRYTSYPPANRFDAGIGPETVAAWLEELPADGPVSLYVHVPFCRRVCFFCACRTQVARGDAPLDAWLAHIAREIALVRARLPGRLPVRRLSLGGGTPTILSPEALDRLGELLCGAFDIGADAGISVEIDPGACDAARIDALARMGVRRATIGMPDLDPRVQRTTGRTQSLEVTRETVAELRARGIDRIGFELLYGLPHQTAAGLGATLEAALAEAPDRIALPGYAHVPWISRRQRMIPEDTLPGPEARMALAEGAAARLHEAGYVQVGIDHFARPDDALARAAAAGTLGRSFQGYEPEPAATLIGFGPSAVSRLPQGFAQNAGGTGAWQSEISSGRLATRSGWRLSARDAAIGRAIERIMCDGTVDLSWYPQAPATELLLRARTAMIELPGLGRVEGNRITIDTMTGARLLASRLDPDFAPERDNFSLAC